MAEKIFRCAQCDQTEDRCVCDKYCCLCQSFEGVRLVGDGLWYCADCREVCGYQTQDQVA